MFDTTNVTVNNHLKPAQSKITLLDGLEVALSLGAAHAENRISKKVADKLLETVIQAYCSGGTWAALLDIYAKHDVTPLSVDDDTRSAVEARESELLACEDDLADLEELLSYAVAA